jgi:hypothetical protein
MSEEIRLLLEMKRTSKFILLLAGFVAGSCILQLAIITGKLNPDVVHQCVERLFPILIKAASPVSGTLF